MVWDASEEGAVGFVGPGAGTTCQYAGTPDTCTVSYAGGAGTPVGYPFVGTCPLCASAKVVTNFVFHEMFTSNIPGTAPSAV